MPVETAFAVALFAIASTFTPGPNNIMLAASGANFGFARTIPHMAGVSLGFVVLLAAAGMGLGALMLAVPQIQTALKICGAGYLLWLAWKIAHAGAAGEGDSRARPLTYLQAAAFQWVNPKGVITAIGAIALYVRPDHARTDLGLLLAVFGLVTVGSVVAWSAFGVALAGLLRNPRQAQIFNICMALALVISIVPMVR